MHVPMTSGLPHARHRGGVSWTALFLALALVCGGLWSSGAPATGQGPMRVEYAFPQSGDFQVAANTRIYVTFSQPVDPATVNANTFFLSPATPGTVTYNSGSRTAIFRPSAPLVGPGGAATTYTVTVTTGVQSEDGTSLPSEFSWSFSTQPWPDITPPGVHALEPRESETTVPLNRSVQVFFSEPLDPSTVNSGTFRIDPQVAGVLAYDGARKVLTFRPLENLAVGTTYTVTVTAGVTDTAGNSPSLDSAWQFTTGDARDEEGPTAHRFYPYDGSTIEALRGECAPFRAVISASFSEPIDATTLDGSTVLVNGHPVEMVEYNPLLRTLDGRPGSCTEGTQGVRITTGVKDLAGNPLPSEVSWSFQLKWVDKIVICPSPREPGDDCFTMGGDPGGGGCFIGLLSGPAR
ncbi:MAG: Ig-like domain-containing protein [Deltaproteobacteria bacterium]|nr:Ig-like domain-containing protein [Deltaproteobacteria bacterium]